MGRHVVDAFAVHPDLASRLSQALEELLPRPRSHDIPFRSAPASAIGLTVVITTGNSKRRTMSAKTDRRSRQGIESRQRILDATFEIAQELGYQGTSIAKVSAR